jgi:hypothetical protein
MCRLLSAYSSVGGRAAAKVKAEKRIEERRIMKPDDPDIYASISD